MNHESSGEDSQRDGPSAAFRKYKKAKYHKAYKLPNPSSLKDLLVDRSFYTNLKRRLEDEVEDLHSNTRAKQVAHSIRHLASGTYGNGSNSWNPNREMRQDSAGRRRELMRMNRRVRSKNLQNMIRTKNKVVEVVESDTKNDKHRGHRTKEPSQMDSI